MKKLFDGYAIAIIFSAICCGIAAIMGLIERHDKKKDGKRPFGPTAIVIYTTEWIRRIMKRTITIFQNAVRRRHDHAVKFDDAVHHRLSPEMMADLEKAPHYTMAELEGITAPVKEPIIITD